MSYPKRHSNFYHSDAYANPALSPTQAEKDGLDNTPHPPSVVNPYATLADISAPVTSAAWQWVQDVNENGSSIANFASLSGTWSTDSTVIQQTDATSAQRILAYTGINPMINACRIIEVEVRGITAGFFAALFMFDGTNSNNGWQFGLDDTTDKFLADIPGGSAPAVLSVNHVNVINVFYKIRAVIIGDMAHCYVDGTLMGTAHFPSGGLGNMSRVGFIAWAKCDFRNFKSWHPNFNLPA